MQAGLPLLCRVDTEDHPFSLTSWDVDSMCCVQSKDRPIFLSPSGTVVLHAVRVVCWQLMSTCINCLAWWQLLMLRDRLFCSCTDHWEILFLILSETIPDQVPVQRNPSLRLVLRVHPVSFPLILLCPGTHSNLTQLCMDSCWSVITVSQTGCDAVMAGEIDFKAA